MWVGGRGRAVEGEWADEGGEGVESEEGGRGGGSPVSTVGSEEGAVAETTVVSEGENSEGGWAVSSVVGEGKEEKEELKKGDGRKRQMCIKERPLPEVEQGNFCTIGKLTFTSLWNGCLQEGILLLTSVI